MNSVLVEDTGLISTSFVKKEQKKRESIFKSLFEESSREKYRDKLQFRFEKYLIKRYICSFKHSCSFVISCWKQGENRVSSADLFLPQWLCKETSQTWPASGWSLLELIHRLEDQPDVPEQYLTKTKQPNPRCTKVASVKNSATLYTEDEMAENSLMD